MAKKSKIYIKPSKRGTLRKAMGAKKGQKLSVAAMKKKLHASGTSTAMKKKLNFAINSRGWKHEGGGALYNPYLPQLGGGDGLGNFTRMTQNLGGGGGGFMNAIGAIGKGIGTAMPIVGAAIGIGTGILNLIRGSRERKEQTRLQNEQEAAQAEAAAAADKNAMAQSRIAGLQTPISYAPVAVNGGYLNYLGQSHQGPGGGIMVDENGNPTVVSKKNPVALVEGGELAVHLGGEPYIFSKKLGYADEANAVIGKFKGQEKYDKWANEAMNGQLYALKSGQEEINQMARGGSLSAAKAGKMLKEGRANKKPLTDKQKRYFRAVAHGWKPSHMKEYGGELPMLQNGEHLLPEANVGNIFKNISGLGFNTVGSNLAPSMLGPTPTMGSWNLNDYLTSFRNPNNNFSRQFGSQATGPNFALPNFYIPRYYDSNEPTQGGNYWGTAGTQVTTPAQETTPTIGGTASIGVGNIGGVKAEASANKPQHGIPSQLPPTLSPLGHLLSTVGNLATYRYLKKNRPKDLVAPKLRQMAPQRYSLAEERRIAGRQLQEMQGAIPTTARNLGLSGAQTMATTTNAYTGAQGTYGDIIGKSVMNESNLNAQARQQADAINLQAYNQWAQSKGMTDVYNMMMQNQYQNQMAAYNPLSVMASTAADYAKSNAAYQMSYDTAMMYAPNAQYGQRPNPWQWMIGGQPQINYVGPPLNMGNNWSTQPQQV